MATHFSSIRPSPAPIAMERIGEGAAQEEEQRQLASPGLPVSSPEDDGYQWKKYGKKYIKSIRKNRSYFKCRINNCKARKVVDWPPDHPSNVTVTYKGGPHNHRARIEETGSGILANQYDLATQVFGSM
ncbi:hypothetical protein HPP92_028080, partial [Vanilla planifolia]